jgi:hypothetical protein
MHWIDEAQDGYHWRALVNRAMNHRFPQNIAKLICGRATGGYSRNSWLHGVSYLVSKILKCLFATHGYSFICPSTYIMLLVSNQVPQWAKINFLKGPSILLNLMNLFCLWSTLWQYQERVVVYYTQKKDDSIRTNRLMWNISSSPRKSKKSQLVFLSTVIQDHRRRMPGLYKSIT